MAQQKPQYSLAQMISCVEREKAEMDQSGQDDPIRRENGKGTNSPDNFLLFVAN